MEGRGRKLVAPRFNHIYIYFWPTWVLDIFKNIWKIQLLKLYTPSNSFAFSPPTTGEIVAEYGNIINIYLYKDLLIFGIYFKT